MHKQMHINIKINILIKYKTNKIVINKIIELNKINILILINIINKNIQMNIYIKNNKLKTFTIKINIINQNLKIFLSIRKTLNKIKYNINNTTKIINIIIHKYLINIQLITILINRDRGQAITMRMDVSTPMTTITMTSGMILMITTRIGI